MKSKLFLGALALSAAALTAGCFGHAGVYAEADAPVVFHEEPTLVVVEPGIWVVRDYDYAVYYVDDYYWVYRDDRWYRSRTYDRGWVTVEVSFIPRAIVSRDHHVYVHYRGRPDAPVRKAPRSPGNDRDRAGHPGDRHDAPPRPDAQPRHDAPPRHDGPPRHDAPPRQDVEPRHDAPPHQDGAPRGDANDGARPRQPSDRQGPTQHDDRSGAKPREDHDKKDEKRRDDRGKSNDHQRNDDKRGGHDNR